MGVVRQFGHQAADRDAAVEVLREMLLLAVNGQLMGVSYMAQVRGHPNPKFGALGCYRTDPWRGLATLERMRGRLTELADDLDQPDEEQSSGTF